MGVVLLFNLDFFLFLCLQRRRGLLVIRYFGWLLLDPSLNINLQVRTVTNFSFLIFNLIIVSYTFLPNLATLHVYVAR